MIEERGEERVPVVVWLAVVEFVPKSRRSRNTVTPLQRGERRKRRQER